MLIFGTFFVWALKCGWIDVNVSLSVFSFQKESGCADVKTYLFIRKTRFIKWEKIFKKISYILFIDKT